MPVQILPPFLSEINELRQRVREERALTPTQRVRAASDAWSAADALSQAGQVRKAQVAYRQQLEEEERLRTREFMSQHVKNGRAAT